MAYKRGDIVVNYPFGKRSEIIKQNITKNEKNTISYKNRGMDFENDINM